MNRSFVQIHSCKLIFMSGQGFIPLKERVRTYFKKWPGAMQALDTIYIHAHCCEITDQALDGKPDDVACVKEEPKYSPHSVFSCQKSFHQQDSQKHPHDGGQAKAGTTSSSNRTVGQIIGSSSRSKLRLQKTSRMRSLQINKQTFGNELLRLELYVTEV